jgi:hypothetical protein
MMMMTMIMIMMIMTMTLKMISTGTGELDLCFGILPEDGTSVSKTLGMHTYHELYL